MKGEGSTGYVPVRHLSTGPEGAAFLAERVGEGGERSYAELRHATVALHDAERWQALTATLATYELLDHPAWRKLLAREQQGATPVLVFEGQLERDLGARLALGAVPEHDARAIFGVLAQALAAAHRLGLIHGRVGPSCIDLDDDGQPVLDFPWLDVGLAFGPLDAACVSPEARDEALDVSSDVYSLGALLRSALTADTGRRPEGAVALVALIDEMTQVERERRPTMAQVALRLRRPPATPARAQLTQQSQVTFARSLAPTAELVFDAAEEWHGTSSHADSAELAIGTRLGRFELLQKIGEGGMGQVFRAIDRATGQLAAIKVLRPEAGADPNKLRRFRKEARILSQIRSPYVASLIECNRDAQVEYLALEYVAGRDLADVVLQRGGRLPEREALAILADVCRGLAEAHARGIVHRDIKPENVLIAAVGEPEQCVKLCDFGIARALDGRGATLAFTQDNTLLGTPEFMAPEQCNGELLSPATDVYALGVTLFALIAGRVPFAGQEPMVVLAAHVMKAPPALSSLAPDVSLATSELVARMLAKLPQERFVDASAVLDALERILRGEPNSLDVHPVRPEGRPDRIVTHAFEWTLRAAPDELWPYVSNTDRLNRAVGLPPASFVRTASSDGVTVTRGSNRVAGVSLAWQEHPFEWIEGRRWGVLRVFGQGVMRWFTIELELLAQPGGGTRLRYTMTLEPRHIFGRAIVAFEMRKQQRALGRAFARIDEYLATQGKHGIAQDPFEAPLPLTAANSAALAAGLNKLRADGVREDMLDALAAFCENAPAQEVARLRPLAFARQHGLDSERTVEACLRGAHHGLLVLLWEVLCPLCRVPSGFAESLRTLADHGRCPACNVDFPLDFAQSLELVFRVAADVRSSELRSYCIGGPAFAPHVVAQVRLAAGERLVLDLALGVGSYTLRSPQLARAFPLSVSATGRSHRAQARFGETAHDPGARLLLALGVQALALENVLPKEIVVRVERTAPRADALTAARAACLASFRELFPGEVLASGRLVAVGRTAFLVATIHGQRELIAELGDARAFERVLAQLSLLEEIVAGESGAVVKTALGSTLCAFDSAPAALRAALALRAQVDQRTAETSGAAPLDLRIAVHQGAAVAATFDGRLDYFGQTVEDAFDLAAQAPAQRVLLSAALAEDVNVMSDVHSAGLETTLLQLAPAASAGAFGLLLRPSSE